MNTSKILVYILPILLGFLLLPGVKAEVEEEIHLFKGEVPEKCSENKSQTLALNGSLSELKGKVILNGKEVSEIQCSKLEKYQLQYTEIEDYKVSKKIKWPEYTLILSSGFLIVISYLFYRKNDLKDLLYTSTVSLASLLAIPGYFKFFDLYKEQIALILLSTPIVYILWTQEEPVSKETVKRIALYLAIFFLLANILMVARGIAFGHVKQ